MIVVVGLLLVLASAASGQEVLVIGAVTDESKAVIPGVTVTAVDLETGRQFTGVSNENGEYRLSNMQPGAYRFQADLSGFATVVIARVELLVGQHATIPFTMKLARLTETVTVTGESPLVDTHSSQVAGNVDRRQMEDLPLQGRNWMELAMIVKGITANDVSDRPGVRDGQFQLNLDGQQITQQVAGSGFGQPKFSREAIAEFQVVTNLFDITQGRSIGIQVQAVSRAGTNKMAGSYYGYFRDDKFTPLLRVVRVRTRAEHHSDRAGGAAGTELLVRHEAHSEQLSRTSGLHPLRQGPSHRAFVVLGLGLAVHRPDRHDAPVAGRAPHAEGEQHRGQLCAHLHQQSVRGAQVRLQPLRLEEPAVGSGARQHAELRVSEPHGRAAEKLPAGILSKYVHAEVRPHRPQVETRHETWRRVSPLARHGPMAAALARRVHLQHLSSRPGAPVPGRCLGRPHEMGSVRARRLGATLRPELRRLDDRHSAADLGDLVRRHLVGERPAHPQRRRPLGRRPGRDRSAVCQPAGHVQSFRAYAGRLGRHHSGRDLVSDRLARPQQCGTARRLHLQRHRAARLRGPRRYGFLLLHTRLEHHVQPAVVQRRAHSGQLVPERQAARIHRRSNAREDRCGLRGGQISPARTKPARDRARLQDALHLAKRPGVPEAARRRYVGRVRPDVLECA
ncbi:MAG: hypothetical protein DMF96_04420 [Acidobacteria bacterium]|nr:MAG: hypothetical protein DMF96_04420 [Acidobacteriota bacterium]